MNRYVRLKSRRRSSSRFRTWLWIDTSSAETGSSQTTRSGPERERPGDADALALAAAELVRVAPRVVAPQADDLEAVLDPLVARLAVGDALGEEALADDVEDRHPGVQRPERVLEDDLHPAPQRPHVVGVDVGQLVAVEDDLAGGRRRQLEDGPAERRLAAAGLADEAEDLAGEDVEVDAVDRVDGADLLAQQAADDREVLLEPADREQRLHARSLGGTAATAAAGPTDRRRSSMAVAPGRIRMSRSSTWRSSPVRSAVDGDLSERPQLAEEVRDDRRAEDHVDALVEAVEEARVAGQALVAGDDAGDRPDTGDDRQEADRRRRASSRSGIAAGAAGRRHVAEDGDDDVAERGSRDVLCRQVHLRQRAADREDRDDDRREQEVARQDQQLAARGPDASSAAGCAGGRGCFGVTVPSGARFEGLAGQVTVVARRHLCCCAPVSSVADRLSTNVHRRSVRVEGRSQPALPGRRVEVAAGQLALRCRPGSARAPLSCTGPTRTGNAAGTGMPAAG